MKKYLILPVVAAMMCSCSENTTDTQDSLLNDIEIISVPKLDNLSLSRAEKASLEQSTSFSGDMFLKAIFNLEESGIPSVVNGNFMFSPANLNFALALIANSADETKGAEIAGELGFASLDDLNETYGKLLRHLSTPEAAGLTTSIANSIWFDSNVEADPTIASKIRSKLYSEIVGADFTAPSTLALINGWCKEKTDGMIPEFLTKVPITPLICANAIYTYGKWTYPFDEALTAKKLFHGMESTTTVDMMHADIAPFRHYYATDTYQKIAYPIENGLASLIVVLPASGKDVKAIAADAFANLNEWNDPSTIYKLSLSMPRFSISNTAILENFLPLVGIDLGSVDIPLLNLKSQKLSLIVQRTAFEMDETGMRAATVTANDVWWAGTPATPNAEVEMTVDRPFLFFLRDNTTGTILLAGNVNNL